MLIATTLVLAGAWSLGACGTSEREGSPRQPVLVADESCHSCHEAVAGLSDFHDPGAIGCVSCHLGRPNAATAEEAHTGMVTVPGNLADARQTCGTCHAETVERVEGSLMATARGIVAVNRFVFGEQATPDGTDGMADLGGSHADVHLRQLCHTCHLGYEKVAPGPVTERSRGGGCLACHLSYDTTNAERTHPALTVSVTDDHCFGCHSRSSRIALNYAGWHETLLSAGDVPASYQAAYRVLADGRVLEEQIDDVHHAAGMACIDCHTSRETMGDGVPYAHQEEATEVRCETCHFSDAPPVVAWADLDAEAARILSVRFRMAFPGRSYLAVDSVGHALTNVYLDASGMPVLEGKLDSEIRRLTPPADACTRPGHERLACESCHTAWVPQCIGCHTQPDRRGQWQEFASDFFADPPVLGVRRDARSGRDRIQPFAPGMILTIDTEPGDLSRPVDELMHAADFRRLYAPQSPHTTQRSARDCASCHLDPLALGYGRGTLQLEDGDPPQWRFAPLFERRGDGLPADAWIPFLGSRPGPTSTRREARPLSELEQRRVLRVGACLTCHAPAERSPDPIYHRFEEAVARRAAVCMLPGG